MGAQYGLLQLIITLALSMFHKKKCIRSIKFAPYNSHTTPLFAETKLLKFEDIITATKLKFAFDYKTGNLPDDLKGMFQFSNDVHSYMTCCSVKKCLFVPLIQSTSYGIKTLKYSVQVIWNQFSSDACVHICGHFLDSDIV